MSARPLRGNAVSFAHTWVYEDVRVAVTANPDAELLAAWNDFVLNTPGGDVHQLSAWARVRGAAGHRALYVLATGCDGRILGGAQILRFRLPLVRDVAYFSSGPLIVPPCDERERARRALVITLNWLGRHAFSALFIQPSDGAEDVTEDLLRCGFRYSNAGIAPAATLRLDLRLSIDALRAKLDRRLRYWTGKWTERGVSVRVGNEHDVGLLCALMAQSAQHQGFRPLSTSYVDNMYRQLEPEGHALLIVGEVDGRPVGADLLIACGQVVTGGLAGFDRSGRASKLSVPAAMRWEAIQWAKRHGYRWFDFGGIDPATANALLAGRSADEAASNGSDRAKISFGGSVHVFPPAVELIASAPMRVAYDVVRRSTHGRRAVSAISRRLRAPHVSRSGRGRTPG